MILDIFLITIWLKVTLWVLVILFIVIYLWAAGGIASKLANDYEDRQKYYKREKSDSVKEKPFTPDQKPNQYTNPQDSIYYKRLQNIRKR